MSYSISSEQITVTTARSAAYIAWQRMPSRQRHPYSCQHPALLERKL